MSTLADLEQTIQQYEDLPREVYFGWFTGFFDLLGINHNILRREKVQQLNELAKKRADLLNTPNNYQQQIQQAEQYLSESTALAIQAKLFYRLAWLSYLCLTVFSIGHCGFWHTGSYINRPVCTFLHRGPIPHLFSIEAAISWGSWILLSIPYFTKRLKSLKLQREGILLLLKLR